MEIKDHEPFLSSTSYDYDMEYNTVSDIWKKSKDSNDFYVRLEEELKIRSSK